MKTREELLKEMNKFRRQMLNAEQSEIVKRGVQEILNAPTQEQLNCVYCHKPYAPILDLHGIRESVKNNCLITKFSKEHGWFSAYIVFCPMCGRKTDLGDD